MAKEVKSQESPAFKRQAIGLIILLIIQYVLGITTNLFVKFPEGETGGNLWEFAWSQLPLALHIITGYLLLIGSLTLLIRVIISRTRNLIIPSSLGFLFIFIAAFSGSRFIPSQQNAFSLIMSLGFIAALISYFWLVYRSKN